MSVRSRGTAVVLALVAGAAALAACGEADGGPASAPASSRPAATSTAPTSTPPTGPTTSTPPLPGASPSSPPLRLTGRVEEGAKPQCRLLVTPTTTYLLLGVRERLLLGQRITVVGTVLDNVRTMCPGVPLGVLKVDGTAPPPPGRPTVRGYAAR